MRPAWVSMVSFLAATNSLSAQTSIAGFVRDRGAKPVSEVHIRVTRSGRSTVTGRDGAFRLDSITLPDTLLFTAVGFHPDTIAVPAPPDGPIVVILERLTLLEELAVTAEREPQVPRATEMGAWSLSQRAIRAAPPAVEADVMRSLILVPAVSFSSVLSARPMVRGYEPNLTTVRVDGFEMPNLYRLGRFLSSFPADATERVTVITPPGGDLGAGLDGHIDMTGRRGQANGFGGGGLSLGSLGAYGGGRPAGVGAFGAVRFLHVSGLALAVGQKVPANFLDAYGRVDFGKDSDPRGSVSTFFSGDDYGNVADRNGGRWHSTLLGGRYDVLKRAGTTIGLETSVSQFHQDAYRGPTQRGEVDVRTRLDLARFGLSGRHRWGRLELEGGMALNRRGVDNTVKPTQAGFSQDIARYSFVAAYTETHGYTSIRWSDSSTTVSAGGRVEHSPWATTASPRVALEHRWGDSFSAGVGLGRTSALYQYVSDPASEPDVAFYDFWIAGGRDGFPVPRIDHASLDARWARGSLALRATGFLSRGKGLIEARPPSSQQSSASDFRVGSSRTEGLEMQATLSPPSRPDRVVSLIWVMSRSRRNWGNGWVPWALDRRHMVRLQLATTIARRWRVDLLTDYTSAPPFTPVTGLIPFSNSDRPSGQPFIYGAENSARDIPRLRTDVGFTHHFNGPGKSRLLWGISLLNVTWGPVFPLTGDESLAIRAGIPLGYDRVSHVPILPTFTLRVEF